jgi:signal transduction histidine kinase
LSAVAAEVLARDLTVSVDVAPAVVRGDPALLKRLIGNLVENAVRHNTPAGWIRIRTGRDAAAGVLEVESSGPVIDPGAIAQLFEPFRQGQRARTGQRGTGLGLSIVRAVVAAHDGTVGAAPVPGGGLLVTVRLAAEAG